MNKQLLPPTAATCKAVTTDWAARRRWWQSEKQRLGTDWAALWAFDREVAALAIRARSSAPDDEYSGLLPTWADACRRADAEYRERQAKLASKPKNAPRLAASTRRGRRLSVEARRPEDIAGFHRQSPAIGTQINHRIRQGTEVMPITFQFLDEMETELGLKPKPNGGFAWGNPDQSILDDRRGWLPDFPVDTLSVTCSAWVQHAAHGAGVTPAHVAIPLIGICSSLIGTARRVRANPSWSEPMTCWCAVVGFSGSGKTPGIDATRRALTQVERNRKKRDIRNEARA